MENKKTVSGEGQPDESMELIDDFASKLSNPEITFGLQAHDIDRIEKELQRWKDMPPTLDGDRVDPKYIKYVWEKLGKELGWCPFTLALYYFEYLEDRTKLNP